MPGSYARHVHRRHGRSIGSDGDPGRSWRAEVAALVLVTVCVAVSGWIVVVRVQGSPVDGSPRPATFEVIGAAPASAIPPDVRAGSRWGPVLAGLATRRAAAWKAADPALLADVYARGSAVLDRDRQALQSYAERGFQVDGVQIRFSRVREVARSAGRVRLDVVDRLGPTTARSRVGRARPLPRDEPSRHVVILERRDGRWLIAAIRAVHGGV